MSISLGSTTYTTVTWTSGDTITEAKMDNMVANDQAYDSHAAQGLLLNNSKSFGAKSSGGSNKNIAKINSSDQIEVGDDSMSYLLKGYLDGWIDPGEVPTYSSSLVITVATDATTRYSIGDKIRLKQGGAYKYFYVEAVTATTLTLNGGNGNTIANSDITDFYYSKVQTPVGFPDWFTNEPVISGDTITITVTTWNTKRFKLEGRMVTYIVAVLYSTSGSDSAGIYITLPIAPANNGTAKIFSVTGSGVIASNARHPVHGFYQLTNRVLVFNGSPAQNIGTGLTNRELGVTIIYEI